jgi:hypothetical protein
MLAFEAVQLKSSRNETVDVSVIDTLIGCASPDADPAPLAPINDLIQAEPVSQNRPLRRSR